MAQALIVSDPKIMMGKPTLAGTRITVELILDKLAAGESPDQILSEHPRLTAEGIRAAIAFAAGGASGECDVSGGESDGVKREPPAAYPALTTAIRCPTGGSAGKSVYGVS